MDQTLEHLKTADVVRLLLVSDSHGHTDGIASLIQRTGLPDLILHMGDHQDPLEEIAWEMECPVLGVAGNCDHFKSTADLPDNRLIILAGWRFFLTHGHHYHVKSGLQHLFQVAAQDPWRADFIVFGHTHRQLVRQYEQDGRTVYLINPGSAFPGREGPQGIWLELSEGKIRMDPLPDPQRP
jgi:putative phosphoesterase